MTTRPHLGRCCVVLLRDSVERWVSLELARINGICANCRFPFPNAFLHEISAGLIPDMPAIEESPFSPDILAFRILKRLPGCLTGAAGTDDSATATGPASTVGT